jgi:hypothetical protein
MVGRVGKPDMTGGEFNIVDSPRAATKPLNGGPAPLSNQLDAPDDVAQFCARLVIEDDVAITLALAR